MTILLEKGGEITLTTGELNDMLWDVARKAAQVVHGETMSRADAIDILGSRWTLEQFVARGDLHPITNGGNSKWRLYVHEVMAAKEKLEKRKSKRSK